MWIWGLRFLLVWPQSCDQSVALLICPSESTPLGPWLWARSRSLILGQRGQAMKLGLKIASAGGCRVAPWLWTWSGHLSWDPVHSQVWWGGRLFRGQEWLQEGVNLRSHSNLGITFLWGLRWPGASRFDWCVWGDWTLG